MKRRHAEACEPFLSALRTTASEQRAPSKRRRCQIALAYARCTPVESCASEEFQNASDAAAHRNLLSEGCSQFGPFPWRLARSRHNRQALPWPNCPVNVNLTRPSFSLHHTLLLHPLRLFRASSRICPVVTLSRHTHHTRFHQPSHSLRRLDRLLVTFTKHYSPSTTTATRFSP